MKFSQTSLPYRVQQFIKRHELFQPDDHLLLACSGGMDSVVLSHLLKQLGYRVTLAHMNFQLRGADSDGDAAFVEELARSQVQGFVVKTVDTKAEAQRGESTQMVARRLRYSWFAELITSGAYTTLLTAHHADDNLETAMLNLIRGTGLSGLTGIKPRKHWLVRPLLDVAKSELLDYAKDNQLQWREDVSNESDDYLRNRIRHHLSPLLNEFGLDGKRWRSTASHLKQDAELRAIGLRYLASKYVQEIFGGVVIELANWTREEVAGLPGLVRSEALAFGFTSDQIDQFLSIKPGTRLVSRTHSSALKTDTGIEFRWTTAGMGQAIPTTITKLPFGHGYLRRVNISLKLIPRPADLTSPGVLYLAPPPLPLHLRPRRNGDRFQPLGMRGRSKKLQDYFVDKKIMRQNRDFVPLLTDANDRILAVLPYGISELAKVTPEMTEVLEIRKDVY